MRIATLGLILSLCLALPAGAADKKPPKQQCTDRTDSTYQFCQSRATTKGARKACKVNKKVAKKQCSGR
jgi:hypothetical protein